MHLQLHLHLNRSAQMVLYDSHPANHEVVWHPTLTCGRVHCRHLIGQAETDVTISLYYIVSIINGDAWSTSIALSPCFPKIV